MLILSKLSGFLLIFLLGITTARCAGNKGSDLESLVQAERSFSQASVEHGIHASFLQFLADDSVVFASAPTNGKKLYEKYPEKGEQLSWEPVFATVSRAGDLGCTAGPWKMKNAATDSEPQSWGIFASVWRRQPNKSWKVILDVGIDDPNAKHLSPQVFKEFPPPEIAIEVPPAKARASLDLAKMALEHGLETEGFAAISRSLTERAWVFRDRATLGEHDQPKTKRQRLGGDLSQSGDVAYEYGSYITADNREHGYYLCVWQLNQSANWKLLLDLQKPIDSKPNESG